VCVRARVQAHLVAMTIACALSASLLKHDREGPRAVAHVFDLGLDVALGAFVFGVGMQLGDCCASGVLMDLGNGADGSVIILFGFLASSVFGAFACPLIQVNWRSRTDPPLA
jgi:uncharacterized membrane protein YedE/YeeE